jgi:hypothetical protein
MSKATNETIIVEYIVAMYVKVMLYLQAVRQHGRAYHENKDTGMYSW